MNELFEQGNDPIPTPPENPLEALVGDGKKFKTVEDLARAKWESDNYIKTLEKGRDQLREDYLKALEAAQTGPQVKEMLDQLLSGNANNSNANTPANDVNAPQLDPKQIESIVSSKLQEVEAQRRAEQNYTAVEAKLKEAFGPQYREVFQQKVRELGLSMDWARQIALTSPEVLYRALEINQANKPDQFQAPSPSNRRSDNFSPNVTRRDWDYYENMRKTNPTLYWNPKTQVQLHQDTREPWFRTASWDND